MRKDKFKSKSNSGSHRQEPNKMRNRGCKSEVQLRFVCFSTLAWAVWSRTVSLNILAAMARLVGNSAALDI